MIRNKECSKILKKELLYKNRKCYLVLDKYISHGNSALILENINGEIEAICTMNIDLKFPDERIVCIKDYNENEGMLDYLVSEGLIKLLDTIHDDEYNIEYPICMISNIEDFVPEDSFKSTVLK